MHAVITLKASKQSGFHYRRTHKPNLIKGKNKSPSVCYTSQASVSKSTSTSPSKAFLFPFPCAHACIGAVLCEKGPQHKHKGIFYEGSVSTLPSRIRWKRHLARVKLWPLFSRRSLFTLDIIHIYLLRLRRYWKLGWSVLGRSLSRCAFWTRKKNPKISYYKNNVLCFHL